MADQAQGGPPSAAEARLGVLTRQLTAALALEAAAPRPAAASSAAASSAAAAGVDARAVAATCPRQMAEFLVTDNAAMRDAIFAFLKDPLYKPNSHHYLPLLEFRQLTLDRLKKFVGRRFFSVGDYTSDPRRFVAALECLSYCDYSLAIKAGVHFTLCGGTIAKLGTAEHHRTILPKLDNLELPGSFSMTELGHGSNVAGIRTTATYDPATREFVICTPDNEASKFWIGGTGQHAKITACFAQLLVPASAKGAGAAPGGAAAMTHMKNEGIHVFAVRLRDDEGRILPGVRIRDNGAKMGLNGVDNGQVWFDGLRVPHGSLLDRFASVDAATGHYSSPLPTPAARFGVTVGGLTTGRVLIAQGAVDAAKIGLAVAVRYSCDRPQFGGRVVMTYLTHQRRLLPCVAATYALHLGMGALKNVAFGPAGVVMEGQGDSQQQQQQRQQHRPDPKLVHALSSGLKAAATWQRVESLQHARECCGGMGFLAENRIGPMRTDTDVDVTFEGDNTVLMQQVARALLEDGGEAARAAEAALAKAGGAPVDLSAAGGAGSAAVVLALARRREAELLRALARASAAGNAAAALDDNLDLVVQLGWAHVDRFLLENALAASGDLASACAAASAMRGGCPPPDTRAARAAAAAYTSPAPPALRPALRAAALVFGLSRAEGGEALAHHLATGAVLADGAPLLRAAQNSSLRELGGGNGQVGLAPALALVNGWGIPDHLLAAPIAYDWRKIGAGPE